ncbi:MAG: ABC transporter permease [Mobilicoccus sp.]|nr:ABC transporter permease [Mobilicoccus sp.]
MTTAPAGPATTSTRGGAPTAPRQWKALIGLPVAVLVIGGVWAAWRATADLDDIEERALAWDQIGVRALEHLQITVISTLIVCLIAIPLGVLLTRPVMRRYAGAAVAVANAGQAAPAIGLLVLLAMWLGFGVQTAIIGLCAYAILPVLQNTITGLRGIDPTLLEAARGMGMSRLATLVRIELPMAVPIIMAGVRTALVLLVGTATLGTFIDAGGLGQLITTGITLFRYPVLFSGALLVALLALLVDWVGRVLETFLAPKGLR